MAHRGRGRRMTDDIFIGRLRRGYLRAAGVASGPCQPARPDRRADSHQQDGDDPDPERRPVGGRGCRTPRFDTAEAIRDVGTGEALTSMLDDDDVPGMVERTLIRPPSSRLGPIDAATRAAIMAGAAMAGKYDTRLDRESATEIPVRQPADAAAAARETDAGSRSGDPAKREFTQARRYGAGGRPVARFAGAPARNGGRGVDLGAGQGVERHHGPAAGARSSGRAVQGPVTDNRTVLAVRGAPDQPVTVCAPSRWQCGFPPFPRPRTGSRES